MPASHDGYILQEETGFKVRPPIIVKGAGDALRFRNLAQHAATIIFPSGLVEQKESPPIPPGGSSIDFTILRGANGVYQYAVEIALNDLSLRAIGESGPKIIVDP